MFAAWRQCTLDQVHILGAAIHDNFNGRNILIEVGGTVALVLDNGERNAKFRIVNGPDLLFELGHWDTCHTRHITHVSVLK